MADRVLVFASDPGRVRDELPVTLARPREVESSEVRGLIDKVYGLMTAGSTRTGRVTGKEIKLQLGDRLPEAEITRMESILELLAEEPFLGRADLPKLAEESEFGDQELFEVSSALTLLGFAHLERGDIILNPLGEQYVHASNPERQALFGQQWLETVPLEELFLRLLRFTLDESDAVSALRVAIEWGRYGDLFEYNFNTGVLNLPEKEEPEAE